MGHPADPRPMAHHFFSFSRIIQHVARRIPGLCSSKSAVTPSRSAVTPGGSFALKDPGRRRACPGVKDFLSSASHS